jgi:hypothetical protein
MHIQREYTSARYLLVANVPSWCTCILQNRCLCSPRRTVLCSVSLGLYRSLTGNVNFPLDNHRCSAFRIAAADLQTPTSQWQHR